MRSCWLWAENSILKAYYSSVFMERVVGKWSKPMLKLAIRSLSRSWDDKIQCFRFFNYRKSNVSRGLDKIAWKISPLRMSCARRVKAYHHQQPASAVSWSSSSFLLGWAPATLFFWVGGAPATLFWVKPVSTCISSIKYPSLPSTSLGSSPPPKSLKLIS